LSDIATVSMLSRLGVTREIVDAGDVQRIDCGDCHFVVHWAFN